MCLSGGDPRSYGLEDLARSLVAVVVLDVDAKVWRALLRKYAVFKDRKGVEKENKSADHVPED